MLPALPPAEKPESLGLAGLFLVSWFPPRTGTVGKGCGSAEWLQHHRAWTWSGAGPTQSLSVAVGIHLKKDSPATKLGWHERAQGGQGPVREAQTPTGLLVCWERGRAQGQCLEALVCPGEVGTHLVLTKENRDLGPLDVCGRQKVGGLELSIEGFQPL